MSMQDMKKEILQMKEARSLIGASAIQAAEIMKKIRLKNLKKRKLSKPVDEEPEMIIMVKPRASKRKLRSMQS